MDEYLDLDSANISKDPLMSRELSHTFEIKKIEFKAHENKESKIFLGPYFYLHWEVVSVKTIARGMDFLVKSIDESTVYFR